MTRAERIELAASRLLTAMDAQHGKPVFSLNVQDARDALAALVRPEGSERDRSRASGEAP